MNIENSILEIIKNRYGSKLQFCKTAGIPQSTFEAMLSRGISTGNAQTVAKLCATLDIDMQSFLRGEIVSLSAPSAADGDCCKMLSLPVVGRISCGYDGSMVYDELGNIDLPDTLIHGRRTGILF